MSMNFSRVGHDHLPKLSLVSIILIGLAWLVPNHYLPWVSAWNEGTSIFGLFLLILSIPSPAGKATVSHSLLAVAGICSLVALIQAYTGKILFIGDVWMVELYIAIWIAAAIAGRLIAIPLGGNSLLDFLMSVWVLAAVFSVGIALVQWTGAVTLNIYGADLAPGGIPFANLAQPNNFCTLCFIGLCGLLWLHQCRKISTPALMLGSAFLLLGMIASQSRTGWLQLALLVVWGAINRHRAGLRISNGKVLSLSVYFASGVFFWPAICRGLLLPIGRTVDDQMQAGVRLPFWWSMLDAISREPISGYGWLQVGAAQERVALEHQPMGSLFEYSHNFVLDMLLWNGLPIGGFIVAILLGWLIFHIRACRDAQVVWLLALVGGVVTHAMLEYPLAYAYFLIPVGLAMGAIEGLSVKKVKEVRVVRSVLIAIAFAYAALFSIVAVEYIKTEEQFRIFRFEMARIGTRPLPNTEKEVHLLTQLQAVMKFYRTEATSGMSPAQLDWMRKVSERYGFSGVLYRYAVAAGLNGRPEEAQIALARICKIHARARCQLSRESWIALRASHPQLMDIKLPELQM